MGTRNLTMVINKGEVKVAQYGQFDGYPSWQGKVALEFIKSCNLDKFKEKLKGVSFIKPEEIEQYESLPEFKNNIAAEILQMIYEGRASHLYDSRDFAKDSLFCEWTYVIDLDKELFEIYRGFNKEPLSNQDRFYNDGYKNEGFYPVKLIKFYPLKNLPKVAQFIEDLSPDKLMGLGLFK